MPTLVRLWKSERGYCGCLETELIMPFDPALVAKPVKESWWKRVTKFQKEDDTDPTFKF